MSLTEFINEISHEQMFLVSAILTLSVVLVNGWTDAPNAISTCVSTRAIGIKKAIIMAAIFNFFGVFIMTKINHSVAITIGNMVNFGSNQKAALIALCAAMSAIVIWAILAWYFGIPTSESHALIAGISGAAVAVKGNFSGINSKEWTKVLYGIVFSTICGFLLGFFSSKITAFIFKNKNRLKSDNFFSKAQVVSGAALAFMHGAQDGQKFMAIFLLGGALVNGTSDGSINETPETWLMILVSVIMGLGTSIGGYRIIKSVGMNMVKLKAYQGFSADFAASLCLLLSSLTGVPVSTTHTKTTAIMGVGAAKGMKNVNWGIVKELVLTWIFTFPGCGLLGYMVAKVFLALFS